MDAGNPPREQGQRDDRLSEAEIPPTIGRRVMTATLRLARRTAAAVQDRLPKRGWLFPELAAITCMVALIWVSIAVILKEEATHADAGAVLATGNLARAFEESTKRTISEIDQTLLSVRNAFAEQRHRFDIGDWARAQGGLDRTAASLHLVDTDGNMVTSLLADSPSGVTGAGRPHLQAQRDAVRDDLLISPPLVNWQTGRQTVQFARKLLAPDGTSPGSVVFSLDCDELSRFFQTLDIDNGFVALLAGDGTILARGPLRPNAVGSQVSSPPVVRAMQADHSGVVRFRNPADGVARIASFRRLQDYQLTVLAGFDEAAVFSHYTQLRQGMIAKGAAATGLVLLAGVAWIRLRRRSFASQQALQVTLETISQGIIMIDAQGRIPVINRRAADLLGLPTSLPDASAAVRIGPPRPARSIQLPVTPLRERGLRRDGCEPPDSFDDWRDDGSIIEVRSHRLPGGGLVQTFTDVTEQRLADERLRFIAHHDSVTGLPNRFLLNEQLKAIIGRPQPVGRVTAVLMVDLDGFKGVNDTMGHDAGDCLLVEVAGRLQAIVRRGDIVARLGGDEFVIVQPDLPQAGIADRLAQRVISHLGEPALIAGQQVRVGASVGIALHPLDAADGQTLLKYADIALYRAKADGRGTFRRFNGGMTASLLERRALENDLRQAFAADGLDLHFQPQFSSDTLAITGFEALLRWHHPQHGFIPPETFVPIAESCGLIGRIGRWALERACGEAADWDATCRIAVNVSPVQLRDSDFLRHLGGVLARTGLPSARLEIEVTEGVLMEDDEQVLDVLRSLKAMGVRLALDDFGTGYSSLSYLLRLPFDKIKIDKSFVQGQSNDPGAQAILEAILLMSRHLNLEVVAEGVETPHQLALLRSQHCGEIQGFLLAEPMPASDVRGYVRHHRSAAALYAAAGRLEPPASL